MANENNFKETVNSLFKGMDSFISAKTVVGEAIHVGDTIILPLMDVSFGVGAGAFSGEKKDNGTYTERYIHQRKNDRIAYMDCLSYHCFRRNKTVHSLE